MANGESHVVRRLLRNAFSEILSLSDRVVALEDKSDAQTSTSKRSRKEHVDISGTVDLTGGAYLRRVRQVLSYLSSAEGVAVKGSAEEASESTLALSPLLEAKMKFGLPLPNTQCETSFATDLPDHSLKLRKVLFRADWLKNKMKVVFCPIGGKGSDIIPTLNPNADEGLSKMMREGCPVHQQCRDCTAVGCGLTQKGNMIASSLFRNNNSGNRETLTCLSQGILSPTENLTFGLFLAHALQRSVFGPIGSASTHPRPRFGLFGPLIDSPVDGTSIPCDSRHSGWATESIRIGSVGAWNIDDEFVLSGWWSLKNAEYKLSDTQLDSCGVALSTFPYANTPTRKIALQVSNAEGMKTCSVECSAKHSLENGVELHPGVIVDFSSRGVSAMIGIKTLLKF